jgi:hypothetical protein
MEALERQIERLRTEVRRAAVSGDRIRGRALRAELRAAERSWDESLSRLEEESPAPRHDSTGATGATEATEEAAAAGRVGAAGQAAAHAASPLLPVRDEVHQVLGLLGVPAAPRLISAVHDALFTGAQASPLASSRLTSLRRDEERSFRSAPFARPYYLCAALTADLLAPARGLLAVSTWQMDRRVIGPLSSRVDFLTAAIQVAERLQRAPDPGPAARRLLWRFAANIPAAAASFRAMRPGTVASAARAELAVHREDDLAHRAAAARRARAQLTDVEQLFGTRLRVAGRASSA